MPSVTKNKVPVRRDERQWAVVRPPGPSGAERQFRGSAEGGNVLVGGPVWRTAATGPDRQIADHDQRLDALEHAPMAPAVPRRNVQRYAMARLPRA
ncbi:hypothetical protein OG588_19875 [Streptomyces prunicolor]|uniref:hypothetical protein n=1 Tax=Streptomyces prunicolor TaxID=67348 RepID=UPI00386F2D17|nr:hypothetical protein OG588_19875 [Streptomyces prunicolor]